MKPKTLLLLCCYSSYLLTACQAPQAAVKRPKPLPQDSQIQVYFNHNQVEGADYTEPYRKITRTGDNLEQLIIDTINSAQTSIDLAVQEFNLPLVAQALAAKKQAGIKVRVIIENSYNISLAKLSNHQVADLEERQKTKYQEIISLIDTNADGIISSEEINQGDALVILANAGIPLIDDTADGSEGSALMHHKFLIVDQKVVIAGSANFTISDIHGDFKNLETRGNANHLLKINSPALAKIFTDEFNLMWGDGVGGNLDSKFGIKKPLRTRQTVQLDHGTITVNFSPISPTQLWTLSSNALIADTLNNAQQSVNLALFVFSEQKLADTLKTRHNQGVEVKALIDPEFIFRYYSEGLDLLGVALANKCKYEANNQPWENPITTVGTAQLTRGDKLHHKFGIIDSNTVITGSHNWSDAANHQNDETLLVINNSIVAAHFQQEFDQLYTTANLGLPLSIQEKINQENQKCPQIKTQISNISPQNKTSISVISPSHNQALININTATQSELETLPGIGAQTAKNIIKTRQEQPFTSLEDFDARVSGIGASKIKKLEGKITW